MFNGKLPKSRTLMHFAIGSSTEQQRKTASSTESSSELKIPSRIQWLFWHIVQSFYQNGNSLRNEKGLSFISHFSEIAIHLVTLVGGFSDLIYSFGQDHPQSLDGQHSFKRSSRNLRLWISTIVFMVYWPSVKERLLDISREVGGRWRWIWIN